MSPGRVADRRKLFLKILRAPYQKENEVMDTPFPPAES